MSQRDRNQSVPSRGRWGPGQREMRLRHAAYYIERMAEADQEYQAGRQLEALAQFDREKGQLDTMRAWLWVQRSETPIDTLLIAEAHATQHIGQFRDPLRDVQVPHYERAAAAAQRQGDQRAQGRFLGNLGNASYFLGEARTAIGYFEQWLAIAREMGDRRGEGMALGNLGTAYKALGEARTAIGYHEQDLAIAREIGDRHGEGSTLGSLGSVYQALGEVRTAIGYYEQRLAITREVGGRRGEGAALGNLGNAYRSLGEVRRAVGLHEQHLAIARETSDQRFEGWALANRGAAHVQLEDASATLADSEEARCIARAVGDQRLEGRVLCDLGAAYALLGQHLEADAHYQQSLTLLNRLDLQIDAARTRWSYGQFLIRQGERERGIALMAECVAYEQRIGHAQAEEHAALVESLRAGGELPVP